MKIQAIHNIHSNTVPLSQETLIKTDYKLGDRVIIHMYIHIVYSHQS